MLAGPAPEALIGPIAATTRAIRVGSGGVMLPHYSPLKVAETFSVLGGLYPGRIDLGLGRAPGTDPRPRTRCSATAAHASPDDFPTSSPSCWPTRGTCPRITPSPPGAASPAAPTAGAVGARLVAPERIWPGISASPRFRRFHLSRRRGRSRRYRERFSLRHDSPPAHGGAVCALTAETDQEAGRLRPAIARWRCGVAAARAPPVPPVEKAMRLPRAAAGDSAQPPAHVGVTGKGRTPRGPRAETARKSDRRPITHEPAARRRSYALIAEAFALPARAVGGVGLIPRGRPGVCELRLGKAVGPVHLVNVATAAVLGGHATFAMAFRVNVARAGRDAPDATLTMPQGCTTSHDRRFREPVRRCACIRCTTSHGLSKPGSMRRCASARNRGGDEPAVLQARRTPAPISAQRPSQAQPATRSSTSASTSKFACTASTSSSSSSASIEPHAARVAPSSSSGTRVFGTLRDLGALDLDPGAVEGRAHRGEVARLADDLEDVLVEPDVLGPGVDRDHQVVLGVALGVDRDDAQLLSNR